MHWNEYHFFRKPCFQSVKFMKFVVSLTSIVVRSAEEFDSFSVTSPVGDVFVPHL